VDNNMVIRVRFCRGCSTNVYPWWWWSVEL